LYNLNNTDGANNTAVGGLSLIDLTTGVDNVAVGDRAGATLTTGQGNIYVGKNAQALAKGSNNEIVLGYNVEGRGSNTAVIGNAATTDVYFGNAASSTTKTHYQANGIDGGIGARLYAINYYQSSDIRLKENINNNVLGLEIINRLNPVSFKWKNNDSYNQGFIAQEVEEILIELNINKKQNNIVNTDTQTTVKSLNYSEFIPSLVKAIQEQAATIESQTAMIESQAKRIDEFEERLSKLEKN
jgi:hypothetical protein